MKRRPKRLFRARREPAYVAKVEALARAHPERLQPGTVTPVAIVHDDSCAMHRDRACDCDPEVRWMTPTEAARLMADPESN